ncbi:3405_t:CDS:2, partial [Ambispora leptoticha]
VGAIYLTLLNLSRHIRYLKHNIILVGIIPGPSELSVTEIHHYLEPIVHELELLWKGVTVKTTRYPQGHLFRGALILIACDTPAARKVSGVSPLDNEMHKQFAFSWRNGSKAGQTRIFAEYGIRYSPLVKLPYMDLIRFVVIDPMHNLYLGTAKRMTHYWTDTSKKFKKSLIPIHHLRIPHKIAAGFSSFTADQWHVCLCECFVGQRIITVEDIRRGHDFMLQFLHLTESLCGPELLHQICTCTHIYTNAWKTMAQFMVLVFLIRANEWRIRSIKDYAKNFTNNGDQARSFTITCQDIGWEFRIASISVQAALDFPCDPKPDQNAIRVSNMVECFAAIQLGDEILGSRVSRSDLSPYVIISCIDEIRRAGEIVRSVYHWPAQGCIILSTVSLPKETNSDQTNSSSTEH